MKTIHFIRHAKSCWDNPQLDDIDRPLNQRGYRDCQIMAPKLIDAGCKFDYVFCSPAKRAQLTIEHISQALPQQIINWETTEFLYTFSMSTLAKWLRQLDDSIHDPLIIGHNPAITLLCEWLCTESIDNVPTCGYIQLDYFPDSWQELSEYSAELVQFIWPKLYK